MSRHSIPTRFAAVVLTMLLGSAHAVDTTFLLTEPYRKQKLNVELPQTLTIEQAAVLREAIDPIVRVIGGLSSVDPSPIARQHFLPGIEAKLRLPPMVDSPPPRRLINIRKYDWDISEVEIAVTVDFGWVRGKPIFTDRTFLRR